MAKVSTVKSVVGFDSAWADKPNASGAICAIRFPSSGKAEFVPPETASFARALEFIAEERRRSDFCLVAIDQPTIVPNANSLRPVERVAGALVSWTGGGVQSTNRSKRGMFDDQAPIWRFLDTLGAAEDPELARVAEKGLFILEVFPALALPLIHHAFCDKACGPRYNPAKRNRFRIEDWCAVAGVLATFTSAACIPELVSWCTKSAEMTAPRKADQDRLDAVICAIVGWHWLTAPREESIMIGDLKTGYMIAPAKNGIHARLAKKAGQHQVPINGCLGGGSR